MAFAQVAWEKRRFGQTERRDLWWLQPLLIFLALSTFIVYTTWAAFQGEHYTFGPYLSPFYSPVIFGDPQHAWFGPMPAWWPAFLPFSPALIILPFPGLFRLTCYYYRGAYYKSFWADPPSCTVGEPRKVYLGERHFPLILHNIHRYFLYVAIIFLFILGRDVWDALWFTDPATGQVHFGIGLGTLIMAANVTALSCYALGCHSLRHLVGGRFDLLGPIRATSYSCVSCLNRGHMRWAWTSLVSVGFTDLYIRLCSMGVWHDWRIL